MRELTLPAPLMLLPGLAADANLFAPQREALGDAVSTPDWITPRSEQESLGSYAQRWAESINAQVERYGDDRPWFLGGMSLGGMAALEMVPHLTRKPAAVFLIASCRSAPVLHQPYRSAASLATKLSPKAVSNLVKWGAVPFGIRDGQDDPGYRLLQKMATAADPARLKWAIGAAAEWTYAGPAESFDNGEAFPPVLQIHGRQDWLIRLREADCDQVIDTGRHLINLSHAQTVNRWLFDHVTRLCGIDESNEPRVEDPDVTVRRRPEFAARY